MAGLSFGLPGSTLPNLAGQMPPASASPGLGFGQQVAPAAGVMGTGMSLGQLLGTLFAGAAAGVSGQPGLAGNIGRGFLSGRQLGLQNQDRQLALEDRAVRKQYLGMQMTALEQEALDRKAEREAKAQGAANLNTAVAGLPPDQRAGALINPAGYFKGPPQPPAPTAAIQEWTAAGKPGTLQDWLDTRAAAGFHTVGDSGFFGKGPLATGGGGQGAAPTDGLTDIYSLTDAQYGMPAGLTAAVAKRESGNKDSATSPVGAGGRMQFMPGTAAQFKIDSRNPLQSVPAAGSYLSGLIKKYGSVENGLAAYNWGPGNVDKWLAAGGDPNALPAETKAYIADIMPQVRPAASAPASGATAATSATPQTGLVVGSGGVITNRKPIEFVPGTQNGRPGQRNVLTGEFKYDPPEGAADKSVEERDGRVLREGDPNSVEYSQAYYRQYMTPRFVQGTDAQGNATFVPIMPAVPPNVRKPSFAAAGPGGGAIDVGPAGPAGGPAGARAAAAPAGGPPGMAGGQAVPTAGQPITVGLAKGQTEDARKNQQLYTRSQQQLGIVLKSFDELAKFGNQAGNAVPVVGNFFTTPGFQAANDALTDIAASYLYSVSGATANPGEVANLARTVTPRPGDAPETVANKRMRIEQMVDSIRIRASGQSAAAPGTAGGAPAAPAGATVWRRDPATGKLVQEGAPQ